MSTQIASANDSLQKIVGSSLRETDIERLAVWLASPQNVSDLESVTLGLARIRDIKGRPKGWRPSDIKLHKLDGQGTMGPEEIQKQINKQNPYGRSMLKLLKNNQLLIPETWNNKIIIFWKSACRRGFGEYSDTAVEYLFQSRKGKWRTSSLIFGNSYDGMNHAAEIFRGSYAAIKV